MTQMSYRTFQIFEQQYFRVTEVSKSVSSYNASHLKCLRTDDE